MPETKRSRRRNYNIPGHAHVLTFSCYHRYEFLKSDRTCQWLAESIDHARLELDFAIWAYVFMPDHAHILVFPKRNSYDIAKIRHEIKHPVGMHAIRFLEKSAPDWLPRITRHRGKKTERLFWQSGGGYDRNIDEPKTLQREIEYIHMNPIRRGLVTKAEDWKWSSAGWFNGVLNPVLIPDSIPSDWLA